jgi:hypothetical protein
MTDILCYYNWITLAFQRGVHFMIFCLILTIPRTNSAADKPPVDIKTTVEITDHKESLYDPNVISFSGRKFNGVIHTFLFNGSLAKVCEIRSSSTLVYFGAPCQFYVDSDGIVSGISHLTESALSFLPSLHREHQVARISPKLGAAIVMQNEPIVCGNWTEFVEGAKTVGYFFPLSHFFPTSSIYVPLPSSLMRRTIDLTGYLFDGEIKNVVIEGEFLILEGAAYEGKRVFRLEMGVEDGSKFTLLRAWTNGVSVEIENPK